MDPKQLRQGSFLLIQLIAIIHSYQSKDQEAKQQESIDLYWSASWFLSTPRNTATYSLALAIWNVIRKPNPKIANNKKGLHTLSFFFLSIILYCDTIAPLLSVMYHALFHKRMVLRQQRIFAQYDLPTTNMINPTKPSATPKSYNIIGTCVLPCASVIGLGNTIW